MSGMGLAYLALEIAIILVAFRVAAEFITSATNDLEDIFGQGFAAGIVLGIIEALPETIVVIIAITQRSYDIAIGAALGGNIVLFSFGIGMVGLVYMRKWHTPLVMKDDYEVEFRFLTLSTLVFVIIALYEQLNIFVGAVLVLLYIAYLLKRYSKAHDMFVKNEGEETIKAGIFHASAYILIGFLIVLVASAPLVGDISQIASIIQIPALWLSLVIIPIVSDLGENINGYRLANGRRGGGSTAIVSFIGSKLENNTLLLGLICVFALPNLPISNALPEFISVIAVNLIALLVMKRGKLNYITSASLIVLYFLVIAISFIA
jgi:cation:H+ antiporter